MISLPRHTIRDSAQERRESRGAGRTARPEPVVRAPEANEGAVPDANGPMTTAQHANRDAPLLGWALQRVARAVRLAAVGAAPQVSDRARSIEADSPQKSVAQDVNRESAVLRRARRVGTLPGRPSAAVAAPLADGPVRGAGAGR